MSERQSLVLEPDARLGVVIHKDGRVRFHILGQKPVDPPTHRVEPFDLMTDKTWTRAFTGPGGLKGELEKAERYDEALDLIERLAEGRECYHESHETASGVAVCIEDDCPYADADALLVDDYETARRVDEHEEVPA